MTFEHGKLPEIGFLGTGKQRLSLVHIVGQLFFFLSCGLLRIFNFLKNVFLLLHHDLNRILFQDDFIDENQAGDYEIGLRLKTQLQESLDKSQGPVQILVLLHAQQKQIKEHLRNRTVQNLIRIQKLIQHTIKPITYGPLQMRTALEQEQQQLHFGLGVLRLVECFVDEFDFSLDHSHGLLAARLHKREDLVQTLDRVEEQPR